MDAPPAVPAVDRGKAIGDAANDWEVFALRERAQAGVWSARIALVLSVPFAMTAWALGVEHAWVTWIVLPVIAAFFAGALFGSALRSESAVPDESFAGRRGALVALAAYIIYGAEAAALGPNPFHAGFDALMGALLISGWAVFPIAFLSGIMAFRVRERAERCRQTEGAKRAVGVF